MNYLTVLDAQEIRNLAIEYLDIELRLGIDYIVEDTKNLLETRQEIIVDELKKIFDRY